MTVDQPAQIYITSLDGAELRQGELLTGIVHRTVMPRTLTKARIRLRQREVPLAIVLSQDCDLYQHYTKHQQLVTSGRYKQIKDDDYVFELPGLITSVLLCEVAPWDELKVSIPNSEQKRMCEQNRIERFQFLQALPIDGDLAGIGTQNLAIDFRQHFTIPIDEVYTRLDAGEIKRRARLSPPYLEHLSSRFAFYVSRIGLDPPHKAI
jgi:hypothetical protein